MTIVSFEWMPALAGGALIGCAALLLMAGTGRIAGVSGIVGGIVNAKLADQCWRLAFIVGLIAGVMSAVKLGWASVPLAQTPPLAMAWVALAGGLVGVGTALGRGCTSGHGVCGLSRGSLRSLVATMVFMATGAAVVFVLRHVLAK